jgi:hypothetical protein
MLKPLNCHTKDDTAMSPAEIRTSLRMPQTLHEHLSAAAEANGHSFSDEVRHRLVGSFDGSEQPTGADPKTQQLLSAVAQMADELADYYPPWYADPFSFKAFRLAVNKFLVWHCRPAGDLDNPEPKPLPGSLAADQLFHDKATVDNVSAMLVAVANFALNDERR